MNRRARSTFNTQIYEEACGWFVECRTGGLDESARSSLDQWLRTSPEHVSAYLEVAAIWTEASSLDPQRQLDPTTLISEATQDQANVVMWHSHASVSPPARVDPDRRRRRRVRAIAASVAALGIVAAATWFAALNTPTYATATGEQRSLLLQDGSTVELNSHSKLAVHFARHERDVKLIEGQALFHVAKDATRPFVVASGHETVRAVGTLFDVYMKDSGTIVTVVEGRVAVLTTRPVLASQLAATTIPPTGVLLSAGEQITVTPGSVRTTEHANVMDATAWTQHRIVFEGASLMDVAEEFNRYNRKHLVIEGPRLDTFHISGVFSSTDPQSLIRFLREQPGLRIVETADEIRIEENVS